VVHKRLGLRAAATSVYAPKYGSSLRLVVSRNPHGNREYIVTNDSGADLDTVVERKMSRCWSVETLFFRDTKQFAGLEACQCRVDQAMVRHVVGLVLLAFSSFCKRCAAVQARAWALSRSAGDWRCCEMANLHPRR
jgi:hypothetical protein